MVGNELLMQFQADIWTAKWLRPVVQETTALGAAYAAGLAVKFFSSLESCAPTGRSIAPGSRFSLKRSASGLYRE